MGRALAGKVPAGLIGLCDQPVALAAWAALAYFQRLLAPPLDLGERCILNGETSPAQEQLLQDQAPLRQAAEVDHSSPVSDRWIGRDGVGNVASARYDQGLTRSADRELLGLYGPLVVRPKRPM